MIQNAFLHQLKEDEVSFALICKPIVIITNTIIADLPIEVQELLNEFNDIIVEEFPNELPPVKSTSHHIDLILGVSFPNKFAYRMTPWDNGEIIKQV